MTKKLYYPRPQDSAKEMGSGGLDVLATPALVAFMENLAYETLQADLDSQQTSVGIQMNLDHLAASLTSQAVTVTLIDWKADGRKHHFTLEARVADNLIARAQHTRFVVDSERFLGKLN